MTKLFLLINLFYRLIVWNNPDKLPHTNEFILSIRAFSNNSEDLPNQSTAFISSNYANLLTLLNKMYIYNIIINSKDTINH